MFNLSTAKSGRLRHVEKNRRFANGSAGFGMQRLFFKQKEYGSRANGRQGPP